MPQWKWSKTAQIRSCEHISFSDVDEYHCYINNNDKRLLFLCPDCHKKSKSESGNEISLNSSSIHLEWNPLEELFSCYFYSKNTPQFSFKKIKPLFYEITIEDVRIETIGFLKTQEILLYSENGNLEIYNRRTREKSFIAHIPIAKENEPDPWMGHRINTALYLDKSKSYLALVHDYGQHGILYNLKENKIIYSLNGGDYHSETVPFSVCFIEIDHKTYLITRTNWNRLDAIDVRSGSIATQRLIEDTNSPHYLDYFHGRLYLSPDNRTIFNDGWIWHPVGAPYYFDAETWIKEDIFETEKIAQKRTLLYSESWDAGTCWMNKKELLHTLSVYDENSRKELFFSLLINFETNELSPYFYPSGHYHADHDILFISNGNGLSLWDYKSGQNIGIINNFSPDFHNKENHEFIEIIEGRTLKIWSYKDILKE